MDVKSLLILKCFCFLLLYFNPTVEGDIPYGICADPECSRPIGRGITTLHYASPDDNRISVEPNEEVEIFVKDYGPKKDLLGIIVRGNRGYISKKFIKETKSLVKNLVPAHVEFKTSVLVTSDSIVTSHQHVTTSYHHQPERLLTNTVPESVLHTQTVQHDFMNSVPIHHEMQNSLNENLQSSHLSSNFGPNDNAQFGSQSKFDQSSQIYDVPEHASHFHIDSGNNFASSHVTGLKSENILSSQLHIPDSSVFQDDPFLHSSFPESGLNDLHSTYSENSDFSQSDVSQPKSIDPSQTYQSFNQHPSSIQLQQQFQQQQQAMHSSLYSDDNFDPLSDEDISKTYAMLSDRGIVNSDFYSNSYPELQGHQSSQNIKMDFSVSEAEFNTAPSQSQYSIQSSDASLYSSINSNPSMNVESEIINSDVLKENINKPSQDTGVKMESFIADKASIEEGIEENEDLESEILAEKDDLSEDEDEEEEEEEEEDREVTSMLDDVDSSSNYAENSKTEFHLKDSISSTLISEESSKIQEDAQNSVMNSNLVNTLYKEHSTFLKEEITPTSLDDVVSPSTEPIQPETKVSEDSIIMHTSVQTSIDRHDEVSDDFNLTKNYVKGTSDVISDMVNSDVDKNSTDSVAIQEKNVINVNEPVANKDVFSDISDRNNNDASQSESTVYGQEHTTPPINDFFVKNEQNSDIDKVLNTVDIDGVGDGVRSTYQIRNLKGEYMTNEEQQSDSEGGNDENNTDTDSDGYNSFENGLNALKSFVDFIMSWIPEPLYSALMDLQNKGISPRVPVFTALCGIVCIFLIVPLFYIKEWSKESRLTTQLASVEKNAYTLSATNTVLEEKLESVQSELITLQASLNEEKSITENLKSEFENQAEELENTKAELESCLEELDSLKDKENEYLSLLNDNEKEKENLLEHKSSLDKIITDQENSNASLIDQLQESENNFKELEKEKMQFLQMKEEYEEKIAQFDQNCNQLLQEAEVWNLRVNELTLKVNEETALKEEMETSLKEKNEEIESLKQLVETFKSFEEIEDPEDETKTKEEKLESLINSSMILNQLKKEEDKSKILEEQLAKEKNKILDMEVESLDAKSEIDKLKMNYNQALQDKAEAQTKLDVLTNYFKDKEIQLQKQLGAQEAVRQKNEEDANSAERRICLIEQENSSYKYQVASMKQEMEETERNLKSQIAAQEKKAHENWIAARAAERKLEDMKQEVTQLRQRLTLLEREQESWANSSRDDIIRPVPKRILGVSEESGSQDMNISERGMFPPPPLHDRLPPVPPPMMLPPDRPLPPLPPPPIPPMFLPPMERHFRSQPWHLPPDPNSDYRTTPPEFIGGRASTPPRGRQSTITDGDIGPNTSSPLTTDTRDSRNSTPPHLLPDFHDVPPPGRPFFPPPPLGHPRLPMHPPYRRDPLPKRLDNPNEYNSRGPQQQQQPPPQEQWQHSRV